MPTMTDLFAALTESAHTDTVVHVRNVENLRRARCELEWAWDGPCDYNDDTPGIVRVWGWMPSTPRDRTEWTVVLHND